MPEPRPLKVFLCHAKEDKPKVRELYRLFEDYEGGYQMLMLSLQIRARNVGASLTPPAATAQRLEAVKLPLRSSGSIPTIGQRKLEVYTLAGLKFVRVPKGKFIMGGTADDTKNRKAKLISPTITGSAVFR